MLTHIVVWKYRPEVEQKLREQHAAMLRSLVDSIPVIETLSVGFDVLHIPRSYDTGLIATFRNRAGLDAYTIHPAHVEVATFGKGISEHVASVDFES